MKYTTIFAILITLLIAGCSNPPPEEPTTVPPTDTPQPTLAAPTPNLDAIIEATVEARIDDRLAEIIGRTATAVALIPPTATATSTATSTPIPVPSPTATIVPPTEIPAPSPTTPPTPSPIPTATTAPTATPTFAATATPFIFSLGPGTGPTEVSGLLSGDNVWSLENSPYVLTGNVIVPAGASLTIRPSVKIDMNGRFIKIDGLLRATGEPGNEISFTGLRRTNDGNYLEFSPTADSWDEQTSEGSLIGYAMFRVNTALEDAAIKVNGSAPRLSHLDVMNPRSSGLYLRGPAILEDSRVCDNFDWGVMTNVSAIIRRNVICGNRVFGILVQGGSPQITENVIQGNNWEGKEQQGGISIELRRIEGAPFVSRNNISDNLGFGVSVLGERVVGDTIVTSNIIQNNEEYQARLGETRADVNMTRNWWGITDRTVIAETIYDEDDEFGLKKIFFLPIVTRPPEGVPVAAE